MNKPLKILIIGAGPCGLAAGYKLKELKHSDFLIFEQNDYVGGLSASFRDSNGFTWDLGGRVIFSHFKEFDALINKATKNQLLKHQRTSYINFHNKWIPYPFQNHLRYLNPEIQLECLLGILKASHKNINNFKEWILNTFGEGIARHFMFPYNQKAWSISPSKMSKSWIAERVSVINFEKVLSNIILKKDDDGWGQTIFLNFPNMAEREKFTEISSRKSKKIYF